MNDEYYQTVRCIEAAKREIDRDPHLANFMLRDLQLVRFLCLDELCWTLDEDQNITKNDVQPIIDQLEAYIRENVKEPK